jgi:hypothetical protein
MPMSDADDRGRLKGGAFVLGGLSFIPLLGVPLGIAAVIWAAATKRRGRVLLAVLGSGGIALTCVLYGALFYFGFAQRGGIYDNLRAQLAQTSLNSLVQSIEFYKLQTGHYPASLEELKESLPKNSLVIIFDPTGVAAGQRARPFYYRRVDEAHYYLRGLGADGIPFTADDIVPQVAPDPDSHIGLSIEPPAGPDRERGH